MNYMKNVGTAMNRTARTENGAVALHTSNNPLVDFFGLAGATRTAPEMGLDLFKAAYATDKLKAIRILFYLRDVRGGQGERNLFRIALAYLSEHEKDVASAIAHYVPEYGRFDDLLSLDVDIAVTIITVQLELDKRSKTPSLLAKWMPSENTTSLKTRTLAKKVRTALGMSPREYRKMLSALRKQIRIIETPLSQKEYKLIDYAKVPSQAMLKYRKAFKRNDETRFDAFLGNVKEGTQKINTATLYPYQVYNAVGTVGAEELWANLPDYTNGKKAIVVADVSGSMDGDPMAVAVSLALYFAERNEGPFKDTFITFSSDPQLQVIKGTTLKDKFNSISRSDWSMSTNIHKVFEILVDTAVKTSASPDDMPETIYIISDMQFDYCTEGKTNFEAIDELYAKAGYPRPNLVFWNVRAANRQVPVEHTQEGVALVSGFSASTFRLVVENKTPEQVMEEVVNSDRYSTIMLS